MAKLGRPAVHSEIGAGGDRGHGVEENRWERGKAQKEEPEKKVKNKYSQDRRGNRGM